MLGALTGMMGGGAGGMSASSSASASQETANNVSSGTISVGGLTMGNKSFFDSDIAKVSAIGTVLLLGILYIKKK